MKEKVYCLERMEVKANGDDTQSSVTIERCNKESKPTDDKERANWSNGLEFLMSCISMSVGLGNVWRFPFTAYENGGGAFLIPYIIVLLVIGKPMYYLEMCLGQFTSKGSVKIWSICPAFLGVGYGQAVGTMCIITYYSSLIALTLYYMGISFQSILPWTFCRESWGEGCVDSLPKDQIPNTTRKLQSSSELYFVKEVVKEKNQIDDGLGLPDLNLTICLFVSWFIIFLVIRRGVKSSGKAAYFLAIFPYVVLIALLVRSVTLEGAKDGILFFLKPNWSELLNLKVWKEAVVQCFFSLAVGLGPVIMFSSYNRFDHNIYRDALIVTSLDTITSLIAGITIFGILGNLAHNLGISDIKEVVKGGTGLAFISYPDAIAKFQAVPQVFAVLFFFMLFVLGVGSIVALQSAIVTIICDQFKSIQFWIVALITSICGFLLGLVYITPGGQWILNLVDFYGGTYVIFVLAIFQLVGIVWLYGLQNLCDDVEFMTNRKVTIYWRLCWSFLTPVMMLIIFIYSMLNIEALTYRGNVYPKSAEVAGWILFAIGLSQFPLWALWYIRSHYQNSITTTIKATLTPSGKWGPSNSETRAKWCEFKAKLTEERLRQASSKPMYYLEMCLGQFTSKGSVKIWSICPAFLGVGYGQAVGTMCIITYYSSLIALTLYYMGISFQSILPWTFCRESWGEGCVDSLPKDQIPNTTRKLQSSSELYFVKEVVKEKNQIDDGLGLPDLNLTICLFVSWFIIFLVIRRGVKSSGKAAYFLAIFPYVVLIALLVRSVTLEGAKDGILFFLKPNWSELLNLKVWKEAVVQCFFSLAVGLGPVIMFSSYNRFDHNIYRDALIVTSLDTITSLIAGITIFGILGNLAHNLGISDIKEVVKGGTGLAFISYPDAIAKFQAVPQVFAVLFFFMLFVLGVGSIVALQSAIVTIICDQFKSIQFWIVALITSICGFLLGLVYITPGGQWILNLVDFYGGTYVIFVLAIFQLVGIVWLYVAGWILFAIGLSQFPLWALWYIRSHYQNSITTTIKATLTPSGKWGPSNSETRAKWCEFKAKLTEERLRQASSKKIGFFWQKIYNIFDIKN